MTNYRLSIHYSEVSYNHFNWIVWVEGGKDYGPAAPIWSHGSWDNGRYEKVRYGANHTLWGAKHAAAIRIRRLQRRENKRAKKIAELKTTTFTWDGMKRWAE